MGLGRVDSIHRFVVFYKETTQKKKNSKVGNFKERSAQLRKHMKTHQNPPKENSLTTTKKKKHQQPHQKSPKQAIHNSPCQPFIPVEG